MEKRPFGTKDTVYLTDDDITKIIDVLHNDVEPSLSPYDSALELDYIASHHVKELVDTINSLNHEINRLRDVVDDKNVMIARLRRELEYLSQDVRI